MKFDTPLWRDARDQRLLEWMCGDYAAADYLVAMFHIGEVWDDLIDRDKPVTDSQINDAFVTAIFDLTGNPFFCRHAQFLRPVMLMGINAWLDSVEYERGQNRHWHTWAFVLRNWYMDLVACCAFLTGGFGNMRNVSLEARSFFQTETLEHYLAQLGAEEITHGH